MGGSLTFGTHKKNTHKKKKNPITVTQIKETQKQSTDIDVPANRKCSMQVLSHTLNLGLEVRA